MSLISIILPVYNAEKYLDQCLDSLLSQTYSNIEIICMNDGSTDSSGEILNLYSDKDSRVKFISQENRGAEVARRRALSLCSGKYVMFCDSDDWYEPKMCEKMVQAIESSNTDIAMCKANLIYETDDRGNEKNYYFDCDYLGKKPITEDLIYEINPLLWNKIFKREIINKYGITFPESRNIRVAWDGFFVLEYLLDSHEIFFLDEKLYNFRIREGSLIGEILRGGSKNCYDIWKGFEEFYNMLSAKKIATKNIGIYLKQYEEKTIFYFKNLKSLEERIEVLILVKAFLTSISRDSDLIKIFKNKYLLQRIEETLEFLEEDLPHRKDKFISFLHSYVVDIDVSEANNELLKNIKRG